MYCSFKSIYFPLKRGVMFVCSFMRAVIILIATRTYKYTLKYVFHSHEYTTNRDLKKKNETFYV